VLDGETSSITVLNTTDLATGPRSLKDRAEYHYMKKPSAIAFDEQGQFATCQESLNDYDGTMLPNFFMGPTLYDSRTRLVNQKQEFCEEGDTCFLIHIDMLHESPLCMGIAHDHKAYTEVPDPVTEEGEADSSTDRRLSEFPFPEPEPWWNGGDDQPPPVVSIYVPKTTYVNVYWAFDGGNSQLVRYDFQSDHGPGSMDHSIAEVRRYTGLKLTRVANVPSGMFVDGETRELLVCDTGADRVLVVDVDSGYPAGNARSTYPIFSSPEYSFNYTIWDGLKWKVGVKVPMPSGIAVSKHSYRSFYIPSFAYISSWNGKVYALERSTGAMTQHIDLSTTGLSALAINAAGVLWWANALTGDMGTWQVTTPCATAKGVTIASCTNGHMSIGETDFDCGGEWCQKCDNGKRCEEDRDCKGGACVMPELGSGDEAWRGNGDQGSGVCMATVPTVHNGSFLLSYLGSDFYRNSFAHHLAYGSMNGSSYLNPYPIMEPGFCEGAGKPRLPTGAYDTAAAVDCSTIDYDSLLLGGCWCHPCLKNPCLHGGTCNNYMNQGYTCSCTDGREGDHCQTASGATDADFPWFVHTGSVPVGYMGVNVPPPPAPPAPIYVNHVLVALESIGVISGSIIGGIWCIGCFFLQRRLRRLAGTVYDPESETYIKKGQNARVKKRSRGPIACANPACIYQVSGGLSPTHCCQVCVSAGDTGLHGQRCRRLVMPAPKRRDANGKVISSSHKVQVV
jgi:hypothetical protein